MPACRVCPVCQVISLVSQISPETIDRAADFIDVAATALRDLAIAQRDRAARRDEQQPRGSTTETTETPTDPGAEADTGDDARTASGCTGE